MKVTLWGLERAVYVTGRTLLTPHPSYADGALAVSAEMERERRRTKHPLLDVWFECHDQGRIFYIMERSDGSGEYRPSFPPGVQQTDVVPITVPSGAHPATDLLEDLQQRFTQLKQSPLAPASGGEEALELEDTLDRKAQLGRLLALVENIRAAMNPGFDEAQMCDLLSALDPAVQSGSRANLQVARTARMQSIKSIRENLGCDCMLAACYQLLGDLADAMLERDKRAGVSEHGSDQNYVQRWAELRQSSKLHPLHIIGFATARALRAGGMVVVAELAERYLEQGRNMIVSALDATTRHLHGARLYEASLPLFCGRALFRNLVSSAPRLPDLDVDKMRKFSTVAEENLVKVEDALLFALRNRNDDLLAHQRTQACNRMRLAPPTADEYVDGLIEQKFYYPRVFRDHLKRNGPKPAER